jgi:hypothetical protein
LSKSPGANAALFLLMLRSARRAHLARWSK